ncbi:class II histone deacetylase complex subunits 2 and 3-domain-containing protein [Kalaharituber pfeilii]|nr:class II histone deacetylase complex subunits 2 and 3-domain-containing protein [Kalaharituber pfeilii]
MAEQQQALRTPIQAGQQPPASGKLSLRERLAQSRRGFDDAVSAYKATPTRADSFSNRLSNSPALGAQSPSPSPSLGFTVSRLSKLDSSARLGDAQLASTNARSSPMRDTLHTHNATSANIPQTLSNEQPRHDAQSELSSQPATFASQLQLSLASLPDGDRAYAPSQVAVTQMGTYSSLPLLPQLASSEHVIMLGLSCGQKETYLQNLNNKSRVIQKYCNGEVEDDPEITGIITELLKSAGRISTHLDLATDEKLNLERQDVGFALSHPKFQFLKSFFDNIRHQSLTIAVFAEPGRALDILELFFRGIKVRCRRTDGFSIFPPLQFDQVDGSITVMLASTGPEGARVLGNYASLVIALDSTFNISDEQVEKFRAHALEVGRLSPILRLVAVNTVEHVKLFLPSSSEHYLPQLMSYVAILRHQAGNLPDSYAEESKTAPRDIARTIIETIETGAITKVSIPNVPTLPIFDTPSQTSSQKSPVISPLQTSLPPHITSSHPPTVVSRVFETSQSEPTSQDIAASPEPLVSNPSVPVATQNSAPSQTTAQPPQHAGEKRRWTEIPGPQDAQVTGSQELPEKKRKVDEETLQHQTQNGDITRISDSQPNVSQVPDDTPDSQPPMDIDGSKLSRVDEAEVTVPPPPQTSDRVPSKEPIKELNNDGQVALTIREHGHTNTSIDPQVGRNNSTEISRDSMEGVIHETDQPSSRRNMNELGPGAAPQQSLPVPLQTTQQLEASNTFATQPPPDNPEHAKISDNNTREDLLASSPEPMDQTADHVQNPASEAIDGLIDPDDFEYPVFEGSAQLPMRATLNELIIQSREELMMTFMNKAREFNSWVSSTSRLQLRFEQMREETKQLKSILSKSKKAEAASEARNQRLTAELNGLRDERNKLRQDLQQARATLISSDKPDVVKMEQLRAENEKLQEQLKSANSQLESAKSELVWARDAYQTATREGGERGKEAEELRRLNETLQRKADERAITLRQMQHENLHKVKDQQINKLKHQLSERDERIRRLENERNTIGSYKGGRQLGTRASSVPRRGSPNASRTSSPGPGALPVMSTLPAPVGRENQNRPAHVQTAGRRSNKE